MLREGSFEPTMLLPLQEQRLRMERRTQIFEGIVLILRRSQFQSQHYGVSRNHDDNVSENSSLAVVVRGSKGSLSENVI